MSRAMFLNAVATAQTTRSLSILSNSTRIGRPFSFRTAARIYTDHWAKHRMEDRQWRYQRFCLASDLITWRNIWWLILVCLFTTCEDWLSSVVLAAQHWHSDAPRQASYQQANMLAVLMFNMFTIQNLQMKTKPKIKTTSLLRSLMWSKLLDFVIWRENERTKWIAIHPIVELFVNQSQTGRLMLCG